MATLKAQILVGQSHQNHGGINPTHHLYLSENSKQAWILVPESISGDNKELDYFSRIIWIPTIKNTLEDALLIIGLYVLKDDNLIDMAERYFMDFNKNKIDVNEEISKVHLQEMYKVSRELDYLYKIIITTFDNRVLKGQFNELKNYQIEMSINTPDFQRNYSIWKQEWNYDGEIDIIN